MTMKKSLSITPISLSAHEEQRQSDIIRELRLVAKEIKQLEDINPIPIIAILSLIKKRNKLLKEIVFIDAIAINSYQSSQETPSAAAHNNANILFSFKKEKDFPITTYPLPKRIPLPKIIPLKPF